MIVLITLMVWLLPHACILTIWTLLTSPSRLNTFAQFYATKFSLHYPFLIASPHLHFRQLDSLTVAIKNEPIFGRKVGLSNLPPLFLTLL